MPISFSLAAGITAVSVSLSVSSDPVADPNGPFQRMHDCHVLTGADVIVRPGEVIEDATIVIRGGMIEAVGTDVAIPADARLWPCDDLVVHAAFVEPALLTSVEHAAGPGTHWRSTIRPQVDLATAAKSSFSNNQADAFRKAGYGVVALQPADGILRGRGMVTTTHEDAASRRMYDATRPHVASFDRGAGGPGSMMGAIALARQTLMDARWYAAANEAARRNRLSRPAVRDDLAALEAASLGLHPMLFESGDVKEAVRVGALADELGLDVWLLGSGTEYQDIAGVQLLDAPVIVPVKFPSRPKLDTIDSAQRIDLRTLQAWEQAPTNLRRLRDAGVTTCVTSTGLGGPGDVTGAMRQAVHAGLTPDEALAAVTTTPARLLGVADECGTVEAGKAAHLVVRTSPPFEKGSSIKTVWISGERTAMERDPFVTLEGAGTLTIGDASTNASLDTTKRSFTVELEDGKAKTKAFDLTGHRMSAAIDGRLLGMEDWIRLTGVVRGDRVIGRAVLPDGTTLPMQFVLQDDVELAQDTSTEEATEPQESTAAVDPVTGTWEGSLEISGADFSPPFLMELVRDGGRVTGTLSIMESEFPIEATWDENTRVFAFSGEMEQGMRAGFTMVVDGNTMTGAATGPMGEAPAIASRAGTEAIAAFDDEETEASDDEIDARWANIPESIPYPLGARGRLTPPQQEHVRIEHATLWTCGPQGLVEDGCLIVKDGTIAWVGPMRSAPDTPGARVIDGRGLHVSPGLIDCHSHTGISGGVNEFSTACTADVGIGDVVAGDDMNWYRQLAGGLTGANQLHGSANPIGGRNSTVKLRWGRPARDFPVEGAPTGIKFALGENVKRSSGRYPDTRMGVEAFIRDRFAAAEHYRDTWDRFNALSDEEQLAVMPPRWDGKLQTLAEIIDGERLIHCHSYRQDEILALLRTCEDYGIRIGTLQHILEGYKVADAIADHGAGASSFSDWWAYKVEVMDAVPWNGAIMHNVGVLVSFNSDDSELATRMNDEAAKAVRYGGVEPMEALKFVCLNPAKQLGIGQRTGSLETGKDADFAIWTASPLDSYSLCQETWIDGAPYFTRADDAAMAARDAAERKRLVELVLSQSLGDPPGLPDPAPDDGAQPAWASAGNPYAHVDDHRGDCGASEAAVATESGRMPAHEEVH